VNVLGFAGMVNVAVAHLEARGSGHLVGISSVAALRGKRRASLRCFEGIRVELPPGREVSLQQVEAADCRHGCATRFRRHADRESGPTVLGGLSANGSAADRRGDPRTEATCVLHQALATHRMGAAGPSRYGVLETLNRRSSSLRAEVRGAARNAAALLVKRVRYPVDVSPTVLRVRGFRFYFSLEKNRVRMCMSSTLTVKRSSSSNRPLNSARITGSSQSSLRKPRSC